MAPNSNTELSARGISKAFGTVRANTAVSIDLKAGSVHALLGENGAGKTTLANILAGLYRPDSGEILARGVPVTFKSPLDALKNGVGMVHQQPLLIDRFTAEENIVLGDQSQSFFNSKSDIADRFNELSERFGLQVKSGIIVGEMTPGERQRVALLKMLHRNIRVLLLDEPTAVLSPPEVDTLFATIRKFAANGVAIMIITHKLREVMEISDSVTVLRGGTVEDHVMTKTTQPSELAEKMVGRTLNPEFERVPTDVPSGNDVLVVQNISTLKRDNSVELSEIDLSVRASEILAIAGVAGNGQRELAELLAGLETPASGQILIDGQAVAKMRGSELRRRGLAYIPTDRSRTGLAPDLTISENLHLTDLDGFIFRKSANYEASERLIDEYGIVAQGPTVKGGLLSGGNQQRVLLARELQGPPRVLIASSPTQGLDVASALFVHKILRRLRDTGSAIVLISEDLDEIGAISDRVCVMYEGRIVFERETEQCDAKSLGLAMSGILN